MKLSRKGVVTTGLSGLATAAGLRFPAGAAEFTYKFSGDDPASHPRSIRSVEACDKIKKESNGRLEITYFPNSQLGGQAETFAQTRLGAIQLIHTGTPVLQGLVRVAGIDGIPFAFPSPKELWASMDGALGVYTRAAIEKLDLYVFEKLWDGGLREIETTKSPVLSPDDMKGLKLRVPGSPVLVSMFKALGSSPTALDVGEIYAALQTHLVDGVDVPLVAFEGFKYYEVAKYIAYTHHAWTGFRALANGDAWRKLGKPLQDIVNRNINAAALAERADLDKTNQTVEASLKAKGVTFTRPDIAAFRTQIRNAGLYAQWRDQFGSEAWALLEKGVGKLA